MKKGVIISIAVLLVAAALVYFLILNKNLSDQIALPYISHEKPKIDPHVMSSVPIGDKLDEVIFDGIFNVSANKSGIVFEDGLGELMGIDLGNIVRIRLKPKKIWHRSYRVTMEKKKVTVTPAEEVRFTAKDLKFTLRRIQTLSSLSPDYILVSQAIADFDFTGPDENNEIRFQFRPDRIWTESDIKEVLSFKVLPAQSDMAAPAYENGTGPYLKAGEYEDAIYFHKHPAEPARITTTVLKPFIDNSTFITELRNRNINSLLSTPFGALSPMLSDSNEYFYKSNVSTCFFALLFNTERMSLEKRMAVRNLINNEKILRRFFRIGTEQQRHIANYKGDKNNYVDYLNYSLFPSSSYYIEEQIVMPVKERAAPDLSLLTDTVRIQTCLQYDNREELAELMDILNDPAITLGKIKTVAVNNESMAKGEYDAVLVPVTGYRSNFLFDLYALFLREPDFSVYQINLLTLADSKTGALSVDPSSFRADKNFFRLDLASAPANQADIKALLEDVYGFMSTHEIGDKQAYARRVDELDQKLALGVWLFSLPSLSYFSRQFDERSIQLFGTASQLSTIEKWREKEE
ncbi:MAG: hypothetical protein A2293_01770 [Elusimicrobia bacterium RIFOXYB2_FULL_49_7]|nr:MAG: hypothetical protein A2293_01770 [Elusimicrobia bacterium RIFOXYB2_FULL_49_7]